MRTSYNRREFDTLLNSLDSLVVRLPEEQALAVAQQIVVAMEKTNDSSAVSYLGTALGRLGEKLPEEQALAGAQRIVAAMEKTNDSLAVSSLGTALSRLGEKLPEEQALAVAQRILAAMEKTNDSSVVRSLGTALGSLGEKLDDADIFSILKSLPCVLELRVKVLAILKKRPNWDFDGTLWTAVQRAKTNGLDVNDVPRFPSVK